MLEEDDGVLELCCRLAGADMGALRGLDAFGDDVSDGVAAAVGAGVCIRGGLESRAFGVDITGAAVGVEVSGPEESGPRSSRGSIICAG